MTATVTDLLTRREQVRRDLAENRRHLVSVLRNPERDLASLPIGDLLCWCDGLGVDAVCLILKAAGLSWGKRISLLSARDVATVCFQIKTCHPETWEQWKSASTQRRAA